MAKCFDNFIGIRCISQTAPKSGLYIDDLEGINLRFAADIADSGFSSGVQLVESKIRMATQMVLNDIARYTMPFFRLNSIVDELVAGEFSNTFLAPNPNFRGVRLQTRESRLLRIRVQSVKIYLQQTNYSGVVEIVDGVNTNTFNFTTDANGKAEIFPNYLSDTAEIYVVIDNTAINPNNSVVKGGCNCSSKKSEFMIGNGWNGSSTATSSFGIVVNANAECSTDEIGCILSQHLRFAIWYRAGIELIKEAITTDRLNSVTLLDSEKCEFLLTEFRDQYDKNFDTVVKTLPSLFSRIDDICIVCNQSRYVQGQP